MTEATYLAALGVEDAELELLSEPLARNRNEFVAAPVFLVGAERSGTTMLRLMLDAHPDIAFYGEFEFLVDTVNADGRLPSREEFEAHVRADRVFQHWNLTLTPELGFLGLANDFLKRKRIAKGAQLAGATVHRHFDRLLHIWPDARFIHLVRDGRDVAMSRISMGWSGNIFSGIAEWVEAEALWADLAEKLPSDRHISLHYEKLVQDPARELERVCGFLGLRYDQSMLEYPRHSTYAKPMKGASQKWRRRAPSEVAAAEFRAAYWLRRGGYPLSLSYSATTKIQLLGFKLQDRLFRIQFKRRRYSTTLWIQDVLSRRIGNRRWRDSVRNRIHSIDNQRLK